MLAVHNYSSGRLVTCPRCNVENEYQETEVHYTSTGMYVECRFCHEQVTVEEVEHVDMRDEEASVDSTMHWEAELCEVEKELDKAAIGVRQKGHQRKLKGSVSFSDGINLPGKYDEVLMRRSASTNNIIPAETGKVIKDGLTADALKQLSDRLESHPCLNCMCDDRSLLQKVEGVNDIYFCLKCDMPYGIDDSMNFFDFKEFLTSYQVDPCLHCGNCDPDEFILEESKVCENGDQMALMIRCNCCKQIQLKDPKNNALHSVKQDSNAPNEGDGISFTMTCSSCKNKDPQKFEIHANTRQNTMATVCTVCNKRTETSVEHMTGQVCRCINASVTYDFDEYGYIGQVKCDACEAIMKTNEKTPGDSGQQMQNNGASRGRTKIKSLDMIKQGDHIAWHQPLGYWHHAIVVEVQFTWINIIHYNGPGAHKGEIVDEWLEMEPITGECYRIDYDPKVRNTPAVIITRAKSRRGEHGYNLLTNNCEHFARWCVTGQHCSYQVQSFYETISKRFALSVQGRLLQPLAKIGFRYAKTSTRSVLQFVGDQVVAGASYFLKFGGKPAGSGVQAAGKGVKALGSHVSMKKMTALFAVAYEIYSVSSDIQEACRQRAEGAIDRKEFIRITIKRTCEGVGSLSGTAVTLTIPVANNFVGLTLGAVIGKGIGGLVGRNVARVVDII